MTNQQQAQHQAELEQVRDDAFRFGAETGAIVATKDLHLSGEIGGQSVNRGFGSKREVYEYLKQTFPNFEAMLGQGEHKYTKRMVDIPESTFLNNYLSSIKSGQEGSIRDFAGIPGLEIATPGKYRSSGRQAQGPGQYQALTPEFEAQMKASRQMLFQGFVILVQLLEFIRHGINVSDAVRVPHAPQAAPKPVDPKLEKQYDDL